MNEKGQGIIDYLTLVGGAIVIASVVIIGLNFISDNMEATMFCKEKGFETGERLSRNTSFTFKCWNTVQEEHCIEGFCETIEKKETKFFKSTIKEVNPQAKECEQK